MTQAEKNLVKVLGQILRKEMPDCSVLSGSATDDFFAAAMKNGVLHCVYDSVSKVIGMSAMPLLYFLYDVERVLTDANQAYAWEELESAAEKLKIDLLMLKGIHIKNFYPDPLQREMCDIDFLFKSKDEKALSKLLTSLGYKKEKTTACHDGWFNPDSGVTIEAHRVLTSEATPKTDYYGEIWSRAVKCSNREHIYHMSNEDMYVHILLHLRSHLKTGSANLKQLADLYIIYNYMDIDEAAAQKRIDELSLGKLSENLHELVLSLFDNSVCNYSDSTQELADYIMGNSDLCGIKHGEAREAYLSSGSKFKSLLRHAFPPKEKIYNSYPFISRFKIFLPFGYIYRLFQSLGLRKGNVKKKLKLTQGVSGESAEQGKLIADFFEKYGI